MAFNLFGIVPIRESNHLPTYEIVCEKEHHVATLSTNTCYNSPCGNLCNEHISVSMIQASDPDLSLSLATIISFILTFQPLS